METLGFVGGTGPLGRGLALRLALAGHRVLLGSRSPERAVEAVNKIRPMAADAALEGVANERACEEGAIIVVTIPYEAQAPTLRALAGRIGSKLVVNCVVPMGFDENGPTLVQVEAGSAAQECRALLPDATVVGAFQNIAARTLLRAEQPVDADVLVCGDDEAAIERVVGLAESIPGVTGVVAGPLRLAGGVESLTPVLVSVNRRYRIHSSLKISGYPRL
jgi:NADPH-dependent F420 reductase